MVATAEDTHQAFGLLASRAFDVVVVDSFVAGNGVDLVTAVKEGEFEHLHTVATLYGERGTSKFLRGARLPDQSTLEDTQRRHRRTPFILMPTGGDYRIVIALPEPSFLQSPNRLPLLTAILFIDATRYAGQLPVDA